MLPRAPLRGLRDRCTLQCLRLKAEGSGFPLCLPQNGCPGWIRAINLPGQSRALCCLSYRAIRSANRTCTGLSPIPAACVATNALAELKWSGTSVLPRVSRRSERRGLLSSSCPMKWWSHGESHPDLRNAIASSCCWTMAPKWTRTPDSHRVIRFCRPMVRRLCLARVVMG